MIFNKSVGLVLVFVACTGFGYTKYLELKNHLNALQELRQIFYTLRSELQYTRATFEEIFGKMGKKFDNPFGRWLEGLQRELKEKNGKSFFSIWKKSIDEEVEGFYLKKEDLDELKEIGKNLEHFEHIDLFIEQLEYKIQRTREDYETKGKLYRSFGIMSGVFLVILLL